MILPFDLVEVLLEIWQQQQQNTNNSKEECRTFTEGSFLLAKIRNHDQGKPWSGDLMQSLEGKNSKILFIA